MLSATSILIVTLIAIFLVLLFSFTNGFHDASSIVATMIACRAATPKSAVFLATVMVMLGALFGGSAVAFTVEGLVYLNSRSSFVYVLMTSALAAVVWNLITWKFGLPSSSTQALIGGLLGATIISEGLEGIYWGVDDLFSPSSMLTGVTKIVAFLLWSILFGFAIGFLTQKIARFFLRNAKRSANRPIRKIQWATASVLAFSYGANDSQKQMGIIVLTLLAGGYLATSDIPSWVRFICGIAMAAGVVGGGWRIMKTLGGRLYPIEPLHSLDSHMASAASILSSTLAGAPVSSTQVVASSVLGVGAADNPKMLNWTVGRDMLVAWLLTIPAAMAISMVFYYPIHLLLTG
ncbi:MAG: inorganic phosphate transporter [Thermoplasmata archaeon]